MSLADLVDMIVAVDRSYVDAEIGASVRLRMQTDIGQALKAGGWTWAQLEAAVTARQVLSSNPDRGNQLGLFGESTTPSTPAGSASLTASEPSPNLQTLIQESWRAVDIGQLDG